mmetsp:Transcript_5481/g.7737  ORF Transcript_5481/g.7737 Transcript_5481/m.7737 type:complete len:128 (+) Transcript_5481:75-458(+)
MEKIPLLQQPSSSSATISTLMPSINLTEYDYNNLSANQNFFATTISPTSTSCDISSTICKNMFSIGVQTFRSCNSLRSITISTLSERYLFYSCTKLTTPPQCQQQQVTPIFRRCYYEGFFYKELYIV